MRGRGEGRGRENDGVFLRRGTNRFLGKVVKERKEEVYLPYRGGDRILSTTI